MRRTKLLTQIPVSQRDLARFLGVSPAMLNLTYKRYTRSLAEKPYNKLKELQSCHEEVQKLKKSKRSVQQSKPRYYTKDISPELGRLQLNADRYAYKARMLRIKLDGMKKRYEALRKWMDTVEYKLSILPAGKKDIDHSWWELQELITAKKLSQTNLVAQTKLRMKIELAKAISGITSSYCDKLKAVNGK